MGMSSIQGLRSTLAVVIVVTTVFTWQSNGEQKQRKPSSPGEHTLWMDPGDVASLDFEYGVGGSERQPRPPFRFIKEDLSGTTAKINVSDDRGAIWNVKFGHEAVP